MCIRRGDGVLRRVNSSGGSVDSLWSGCPVMLWSGNNTLDEEVEVLFIQKSKHMKT